MSYANVIMAGFGGQGVMLIGNLLAQSGMEAGKNVTFMPVYGAEMRGGTANCTVVVSSEPVGSPVVKRPLATIIMNLPSLDKFQTKLHTEGVQIVNASLISKDNLDTSLRTVYIPMNDMAQELGVPKLANMVALGAYLKATKCLPFEVVEKALSSVVSAHYAHLIPKNAAALKAGFDFA